MNLPESVVAGTHNTEEGLLRRLAEFRAVNTEDETVLNYFDELEVHPDHIGKGGCFWRFSVVCSMFNVSTMCL